MRVSASPPPPRAFAPILPHPSPDGSHGASHHRRPSRGSAGSDIVLDGLFAGRSASSALAGIQEDFDFTAAAAVNIMAVLENPREKTTLLEEIWNAEPPFVVPPCSHPLYLHPPAMSDFQPYIRRIRAAHKAGGYRGPPVSWARLSRPPSASTSSEAASPQPSPAAPDPDSSLSIVPPIFFRPEFDLRDPSTFEEVLSTTAPLALQQKLTLYLDKVEDEIAALVRSRADGFVSALSTLQDLEGCVTEACICIHAVRARLARMKRVEAVDAIKRLAHQRRRDRLGVVSKMVAIMARLRGVKLAVASLIGEKSYISALDAIEDAEAIIRKDLSGVHAVLPLFRDLGAQRSMIGEAMSHGFVLTAVRLLTVGPSDEDNYAGGDPYQAAIDRELKPLLQGLARVGQLEDALIAYQKRLVTRGENNEIKTFVSTNVTESLRSIVPPEDFPESSAGGAISRLLESLGPASFLSVLSLLHDALLTLLRRAQATHELVERVLDVVETGAGVEPGTPAEAQRSTVDKLRAINSGVVAVVNTRIQSHVSKLVSLRAALHARLKVEEFVQLYACVCSFCAAADGFTDTSGAAASVASATVLRAEVNTQAKDFLHTLHSRHVEALGRLLDAEQWKQADVPAEVQHIVSGISTGASLDGAVSPDTSTHDRSWMTTNKELTIGARSYKVVGSCLMMVKMLGDYVALARGAPTTASDATTRCVELLRLFNTRTTQLILKAGAMKVAGLKMISTKHLALCCQCLSAVMTLIAQLKVGMSPLLPPQHHGVVLVELDRVAKDYQAHSDHVLNKIVAIVMDISDKSLVGLDKLDWNDASGGVPSAPMRKVIEATSTLHKLMTQTLDEEQVELVFCEIGVGLSTKLSPAYTAVPLSALTNVGKDRVAADIKHLLMTLRRCHGLKRVTEGEEPAAAHRPPITLEHQAILDSAASALDSVDAWVNRHFYGLSAAVSPQVRPTSAPAESPASSAPGTG